MKVAVIGAGMAGLTAARLLQEAGAEVTVFDKSKGTGGRLASRSLENGWLDHGAPYFSADNGEFDNFLRQRVLPEVLVPWQAEITGELTADEQLRYVGVPRNSAVTRALLGSLNFQPSTRIARLERTEAGWQLYNDGESSLGWWQQVVIAVPAPQALALVRDIPELAEPLTRVHMEPCWVAALQTDCVPESLAEVTLAPHPHLRRVTRNSAKPGRNNNGVYLVQATADWSREHLEESPAEVGTRLRKLFLSLLPAAADCDLLLTHRWRYGFTEQALNQACLRSSKLRLGLCGDWCLGRRVEDAWHSGHEIATRILASVQS